MTSGFRSPVLIVEGAGDIAAVPHLIRRTLNANGIFDFQPQPKPISKVDVYKLLAPGALEKYASHAVDRAGDSVLIVLDCEDHIPNDVINAFDKRIETLKSTKPIRTSLFTREYETMFLHCLDNLKSALPQHGWLNDIEGIRDPENIRGAKECLSKQMIKGVAYKESRDQAKFTEYLDFPALRRVSNSFNRFEATLENLYNGR